MADRPELVICMTDGARFYGSTEAEIVEAMRAGSMIKTKDLRHYATDLARRVAYTGTAVVIDGETDEEIAKSLIAGLERAGLAKLTTAQEQQDQDNATQNESK